VAAGIDSRAANCKENADSWTIFKTCATSERLEAAWPT